MSESPAPYRVLARKYRPQTFGELIGQDAMVQTLGNAIRRGRLAHAFLMTGVRGVGKTSTARLIAKALNCIGLDGQGGPTIDPCGICEPCKAIAEGRHIDVVEMDAASHTGVDDVREIIEAVRYAAVSARYKIYIIDEVHMLSKNAFNALLKTLEEPPAHVKFLFATTEVNKVPVTVLSRCQRFDLRRIPADLLATHFQHVVDEEKVSAESEALALIARAAEGSARDGLSILDQAIAHAGTEEGGVTAVQVREMLGLSDRGAVRRLFALLLSGDAPAVLTALAEQHALGVEPAALFRGLLEAVHGVTRAKAGGAPDPAQSVEERAALEEWAGKLGHATLHRLWQLLLKGLGEVETTAMPMEAAEMALLRVVHAGTLPDPGELLRRLQSGEPMPAVDNAAPMASGAPTMAAKPVARVPETFPGLIEGIASRHAHLAQQLHDYASLVRYAPPELAIHPKRPIDGNIAKALGEVFPIDWQVALTDQPCEPTLREQELAAKAAAEREILDSPVVAAIRSAFPGAELIEDERSIA
ncbi:DNA polymerase III subunit gamma/tau [Sphingomonas sp. CGMCC 1.13654]|uniref:DNA polymerase III subunit gamma/tau n=1 Tax=Sphingomonas chungangi TaxID=2683589 RepID=A0A838LDX3_9SPHN|nr:DNA polymerase III subunit gamma/tau [Sphingomonas chungangi]MBA2936336.1 DNA polymerase III subunit gamma/tau [Sphingomonas chungangi]MVW55721.1 DNA polymerase III subunit gamma/tau [Sphingomonas chungangi]